MFGNSGAFSGFSTNDLDATRTFYGETLGVKLGDNPMGMVELHLASGGIVIIYPKDNHEPATFTVLNFEVDDIDEAVDALTAKGIVFERYEGAYQDEKAIARGKSAGRGPDIAWFKDPAGNILSVLAN